MSDVPRIASTPVSGSTAELELSALAAVYRHAIERYEEAKAAEADVGEDAKKEINHEFRATPTMPR